MGDFTIDSTVFDIQEEAADSMIEDFGVNCTLHFTPLNTPCPNCYQDTISQKSTNKYKSGGPYPFTTGQCPYCQGAGFIVSEPATSSIKMKVYTDPKEFTNIGISVKDADGLVQAEGYISDLPQLRRAVQIDIFTEQANYYNYSYRIFGEPVPHGFRKKYFLAFFQRV